MGARKITCHDRLIGVEGDKYCPNVQFCPQCLKWSTILNHNEQQFESLIVKGRVINTYPYGHIGTLKTDEEDKLLSLYHLQRTTHISNTAKMQGNTQNATVMDPDSETSESILSTPRWLLTANV